MITPCGYRVLVKPDPIETTVGSIIVLSSEQQEKLEKAGQELGTIAAIGPLAWKAHLRGDNGAHIGQPWAQVGDKVQYSRYGGKFIKDP
jgi:co-chaperonin GroES (HSP10)